MNNFQILKTIHVGSTNNTVIQLVRMHETRKKLVLKRFQLPKLSYENILFQLQEEVSILKALSGHPNIIEIYDAFLHVDVAPDHTEVKEFIMVFEYCNDGDLLERIEKYEKIPEKIVKIYFRELVDAVFACHKLDICHRDIKAENCVFHDDVLKLADFGCAIRLKPSNPSTTTNSTLDEERRVGTTDNVGNNFLLLEDLCGTDYNCPPEMLSRQKYNGKMVDIWQLGCCLYSMLTGCFLFNEEDPDKLLKKILSDDITFPNFISV